LPLLETVLAGPQAWDENETIRRAIEIRDGQVVNPSILEFQDREAVYPHAVRPTGSAGSTPVSEAVVVE
jgi:hypothetical protein